MNRDVMISMESKNHILYFFEKLRSVVTSIKIAVQTFGVWKNGKDKKF